MSPNSSASSEPLSSPTPSPPPPAARPSSSKPSSSNAQAVGLESDSDLSDLTDDDEEDRPRRARQPQRPPVSSASSGGTRRRGGLVPAPMWEWAYKKKDSSSSSRSASANARRAAADGLRDSTASESLAQQPSASSSRAGSPSASALDKLPQAPLAASSAHDTPFPSALDIDDDGNPLAHLALPDDSARPNPKHEIGTEGDDADKNDETIPPPASSRRKASLASSRNFPPPPKPNQEEDTTPSDDGEDKSIDLEWASTPYPKRVHPDDDGASDWTFLPPRHAAQRRALLVGLGLPSDARTPLLDDGVPLNGPELISAIAADVEESPPAIDDDAAELEDDVVDDAVPSAKGVAGDEDADVEVEVDTADATEVDPKPSVPLPLPEPEVEVEVEVEEDEDDEDENILEAETDLQPPQRAEALDILAGIEVKFAILRERIYIDKMEEIAREEALIKNDNHPEVRHFLEVLEERKEHKLELANRRREMDEEFATKKRKADEDAVWSWWRVQKEELRDVMVQEANGKRRRLEREKRSLESRMGVRRPLIHPNLSPLPPLAIKQVIRQYHHPASSSDNFSSGVYPALPTLNENEIYADLELVSNARRQAQRNMPLTDHIYRQFGPDPVPPMFVNGDVGGEYGIINGSQYAGMPPPSVPVPSTSSSSSHHQRTSSNPGSSSNRLESFPSQSQSRGSAAYAPSASTSYTQQVPVQLVSSRKRSLSPPRLAANSGWPEEVSVAGKYRGHKLARIEHEYDDMNGTSMSAMEEWSARRHPGFPPQSRRTPSGEQGSGFDAMAIDEPVRTGGYRERERERDRDRERERLGSDGAVNRSTETFSDGSNSANGMYWQPRRDSVTTVKREEPHGQTLPSFPQYFAGPSPGLSQAGVRASSMQPPSPSPRYLPSTSPVLSSANVPRRMSNGILSTPPPTLQVSSSSSMSRAAPAIMSPTLARRNGSVSPVVSRSGNSTSPSLPPPPPTTTSTKPSSAPMIITLNGSSANGAPQPSSSSSSAIPPFPLPPLPASSSSSSPSLSSFPGGSGRPTPAPPVTTAPTTTTIPAPMSMPVPSGYGHGLANMLFATSAANTGSSASMSPSNAGGGGGNGGNGTTEKGSSSLRKEESTTTSPSSPPGPPAITPAPTAVSVE